VWLAAEVRRGRLERIRAGQAAAATVVPAALVAAPFLAWHPADLLTDAVAYHLGLVGDTFPIGGHGLPALLLHLGVLTDPFASTPLWATALPAAAVIAAGTWWVWTHPGLRSLLVASGVVLLGVLFFHRSFMFSYLAIPTTALLLAPLVTGRAPPTSPGPTDDGGDPPAATPRAAHDGSLASGRQGTRRGLAPQALAMRSGPPVDSPAIPTGTTPFTHPRPGRSCRPAGGCPQSAVGACRPVGTW
jgi:hypothetical protein